MKWLVGLSPPLVALSALLGLLGGAGGYTVVYSGACQTCHRYPETEILARAEAIQDRTRDLRRRAQTAVLELVQAMERAPEEKRARARPFHRKAQWRLDYVFAENSGGFHAPAEAARILAESIDEARKGLMSLSP